MKYTLSLKLLQTLQNGKALLSDETLRCMAHFVDSQRLEDYSFAGKSGKADSYYTMFGWLLSYLLGIRLEQEGMRSWLARKDINRMDLVHYAAHIRCTMIKTLMQSGKAGLLWQTLGFSPYGEPDDIKGFPHDDSRSPYSQFVRLSLREDSGRGIGDKDEILHALAAYRLPGGGYRNTTGGLAPTTNATVAALAVRGQLESYKANEDVLFLRSLQDSSGGFRAAGASPVPDLLSTATALFILKCYGVEPDYPARDFIEAHALEAGGFSATILEETSDVEYTFYGLLALGTL